MRDKRSNSLCAMASLNRIKNWPEFIAKAHHHVNELALLCGVRSCSIQRFFNSHFREAPLKLLRCHRLIKAVDLLQHENLNVTLQAPVFRSPTTPSIAAQIWWTASAPRNIVTQPRG